MDRYIEFNPVKFLKESKNWKDIRRDLEHELDNLGDLKAIVSDGMPHGTSISNPTQSIAMQRYELVEKIRRIDCYIAMLDYARSRLTVAENEVLDIFFFRRGYIPPKIEKYGMKYGLCRSDVYTARRKALEHLSEVVCERLYNPLSGEKLY